MSKAKAVQEVIRFRTASDAEAIMAKVLAGGAFVTVSYRGRTDGKIRRRLVRGGAVKPETLTGAGPNYDRTLAGVIQVYDMTAHGYRSIPAEGLYEIKRGASLYVRHDVAPGADA